MPSPLLQLRIPQDLADWLEAKYPSRGEVAEYVRQLLTAEQMKEAVDCPVCFGHGWVGVGAGSRECERCNGKRKVLPKEAVAPLLPADYVYDEIPIGGGVKESRLDARFIGRSIPTNAEFDAYKAESKPKARRKKVAVVDPATATESELRSALPARCNRGACTGTIKPNGHCMICNQRPRIQDW